MGGTPLGSVWSFAVVVGDGWEKGKGMLLLLAGEARAWQAGGLAGGLGELQLTVHFAGSWCVSGQMSDAVQWRRERLGKGKCRVSEL